MKRLSIIAVALAIVSVLTIVPIATPGLTAYAQAAPPKVVCVPATALNPAVPHDTWSGLDITLKGTAHDPDGDATLATYEWDFGDGSSVETGAVTDPYAIEARHTYTGNIGDLFVATLRVTDTSGETGSDQYLVEIKDGTDLTVKVNVAIDEGLWYLHKQQIRDTYGDGTKYGYWYNGAYPNQHPASNTGAATEAFEIQGSLPDGDVNQDPYVDTVQRGLNYLLANTHFHDVPVQTYGDPDSNGNGKGLGSYTDAGRTMYECGITLMAFASSQSPDRIAATGDATWVKGRKYRDIVQDMVDYLAWGQNESGAGRGGWRYAGNYSTSDNSCSQWPVIGMEAAETNFGSTIPSFVRDELEIWLNATQNPDGGFIYAKYPGAPWQYYCSNVARTGAGLAMMTFCEIPTTDLRFQNALSYLDTHWTDDHGCMEIWGWDNHFTGGGNYYAFYGVMKGMRLPHPDLEMIGSRDWYADYADFITGDQEAYGGWMGHKDEHNPYLATAWAILTLKKTVVQPGPVADAGPDVPNHPPLIEITFDGTGSFHRDPSRNIVQYIWDFGDGSPPVEGSIVTHAFPAVYHPDGTIDWAATTRDYTVTLTVVDDSDPPLTDSDTAIVHITPPPWPPVADANGPYTVYQCWTLTLDGSGSYDPNGALYPDPDHPWHGEIVSWEWDLDNDGEYDDATGQTTTWSSCDLGVHVVGLKVTNSFGDSDEVDTVINVVEPPPEADSQVVGVTVDYLENDLDPDTPELEIPVSENLTIAVTSVEHNLGPGEALSTITFLADIPQGCEGQWLPPEFPESDTMRPYDPGFPLDQGIGNGPTEGKDPGDGILGTAESVAGGDIQEPVSQDIVVTQYFELHCYEPSFHTFRFVNKQEVLPPQIDPDLSNNFKSIDVVVAAIAEADVAIEDWSVPVPQSILAPDLVEPGYLLISERVTIQTVKTLHNLGPWGPVDVVGETSVDAPGIDVSGPDSFAADDLTVSQPVDVGEDFAIHCFEPSRHTVTLRNEVTDVEPEDIHIIDPNPENDRIERTLEIECVIPVDIDIKPGSFPNSINMKSKGKIPVAILSSETFDAPSQVDPESPTFGRTGTEESLDFCNPSPEDVNGDGLLDLVCHFNTQETGFVEGDELGILRGYTIDRHLLRGEDSVRIVPKGK